METLPASPARNRIPKWLVPAFGYAIAIASLIWVFHQFDYRQLERDVRTLHWGWVALGILLNLLAYVVDGYRWSLILHPAEEAPPGECIKAVFVGIVANGVLPAKAGEVIRCYLLSHWTDTHLSLALTSDAIGRVMDGIWMVVAFYLLTFGMTDIPRALRDGTILLAIGVAVLTALFLFVLFRRDDAHLFVSGSKWASKFEQLLHEIHSLGDLRTLAKAFALSSLYLLLPILSVAALFRAYGFDFTLQQAGIVLVIVHIGTTLPNAPANLGSFQFFATLALDILGAERPDAKIFSLILFFVQTLPQMVIGALVLLFTGLKLGEVHTHARHAHHFRRVPEQAPAAKD
jgi:glycosyltransferase 2 family protein